jgi:hypothetical protein
MRGVFFEGDNELSQILMSRLLEFVRKLCGVAICQ